MDFDSIILGTLLAFLFYSLFSFVIDLIFD